MIALIILIVLFVILFLVWLYGCLEVCIASIFIGVKLKDFNPIKVIPDVIKRKVFKK